WRSSSRPAATWSCQCKLSTTCSAPSAISTPTTMIPTSPANSRQPCSGLGRWKCTGSGRLCAGRRRQNWLADLVGQRIERRQVVGRAVVVDIRQVLLVLLQRPWCKHPRGIVELHRLRISGGDVAPLLAGEQVGRVQRRKPRPDVCFLLFSLVPQIEPAERIAERKLLIVGHMSQRLARERDLP